MREKGRQQNENHPFIDQKMSRRTAIKQMGATLAVGLPLGAFGWEKANDVFNRKDKDPYLDINSYRLGYPNVSDSRKERLLSSIELRRVRVSLESSSDEEIMGRISPDKSLPHVLVIKGEADPSVSVNILELSINDKEIIVPIVRSGEYAQACTYLGDLENEGEFHIRRMSIPFPNVSDMSSLEIEAYSIAADPFTQGVIRNIPELYVRQDNKEDDSIANDIPLAFDVQLRESWSNVRLVEYTAVFSGEDGGSAPYPLIDKEGRLTDNEAFAFTKLTDIGMTVEEAYQGKSHNVHIANRYIEEPKVIPMGKRQQYVVDTDNNMVKPGNETGRFFSSFPDFFQSRLGILGWEEARDRNKAMKTISIRESVGQGFLKHDDKYIQWFIQNELDGNDLILPFIQHAEKNS